MALATDDPSLSVRPATGAARWELYRLLAEPVRLRLLALAAEEELAIGELADLLGESQPNVSRHAAPLKQAGLVQVRKQGQRALVKLAPDVVAKDAVVADAVASGRALCEADGSLGRVVEIIRARDAVAREFFSRVQPRDVEAGVPAELSAYVLAIGALVPRATFAIDAGTGDGGLLEVLAPVFGRVVGIDRSAAQIGRAKMRAEARGWKNVELVQGELGDKDVRAAVGHARADAVFAVRLLHHAPRPAEFLEDLGALCRPDGALVLLDYARHDDESMRHQADVWLGFEPRELRDLLRGAGFDHASSIEVPRAFRGRGPDAHLPWQLTIARRAISPNHETVPRRSKRRNNKRG